MTSRASMAKGEASSIGSSRSRASRATVESETQSSTAKPISRANTRGSTGGDRDSVFSFESTHSTASNDSNQSGGSGTITSFDVRVFSNQMLGEQRVLVQETWERAIRSTSTTRMPIAAITASLYNHLFTLMPETRLMFKNDVLHQGKALAGTLSLIFKCLGNVDEISDQLKSLSKLHVAIGVTPQMFDAFGEALVFAMKERLGEEWNEMTEQAWRSSYRAVSTLLQNIMDRQKWKSKDIPGWMRRRLAESKPDLKRSWLKAQSHKDFMEKFYVRFFEQCPDAKPLFKNSLTTQGQVLHGAMAHLIKAMDKPEKLDSQVKKLGKMHAQMNVTPTMFYEFNNAMLWTLKETLGSEFDADLEGIWRLALTLLVRGMISRLDNRTLIDKFAALFTGADGKE
eukprot:comp15475_c0_seq1/m.12461 comp15475_c0_seq1/g.12461  ORF comp15475_c0_seq1/g.12461 comp15475_c0_seq1/m.12461 type:complete len:398 (-) comp15475_c0_seq1:32-1225(-)